MRLNLWSSYIICLLSQNVCNKILSQVSNFNNMHFGINYSVVLPLIIIYGGLWMKWNINYSLLKWPSTIKLVSAMLTLNVSIPIIILLSYHIDNTVWISYWWSPIPSYMRNLWSFLSAPKFQECTIKFSYKALSNSPLFSTV